ncbi:MAG TPA: antibiotic biosynthesis monooxygenase [Ktedonobacteraceae bacterium]
MYAVIRRLKVQPGTFDEVAQRDESGLVPILRNVPGFVEFDLVQVGEDVGLSITVFETQEQAEEANRRAADWVKQNIAPLVAGPPETVAVGEVRLRKGKDSE